MRYDTSDCSTIGLLVTSPPCFRLLRAIFPCHLVACLDRVPTVDLRGLGSKFSSLTSFTKKSFCGHFRMDFLFASIHPCTRRSGRATGSHHSPSKELEADPTLLKRSGSTVTGTKSFRPSSVLSSSPRFGSRASQHYYPKPDPLLA